MDRIKKLKIKKQDGTFSDYIPIGADAENIDTTDGESVQLKLNKKPYYYNSVADMKADTKLKAGDMAVTLGYYSANDGGRAEYKIINNGYYTDDGGSYHELENSLFAELIIKDSIIVEWFGAYGDNIHDDYEFLSNAINFAKIKKIKLKFNSSSVYLLSQGIDISNLYVDFNNCTLKNYNENNEITELIKVESESYYTFIENGNLDCTSVLNGINLVQARKCYINNFNIININGTGLRYTGGYEVKVNHLNLTGDGTSHCYGCYNQGHDSSFSDIVLIDCYIGIFNHGFNYYNDIHGWIASQELYYHSCLFDIDTNPIMGSDIYSDTYHWAICTESDIAECVFDNFYCLTSERVLTIEMLNNEPISLHHSKTQTYNARMINITSGVIMAPSFGINWNTNQNNEVIPFAGVINARFASAYEKYLQGLPPSAQVTLPNTLERTTELTKINMTTVEINWFFKILTVGSSYSITLPFVTTPSRLVLYQTNQWDIAEPVGIAYFTNSTATFTINPNVTLIGNRYLHVEGTIPRIYRNNN